MRSLFLVLKCLCRRTGFMFRKRKWLIRELHKRGFVHLRGSESLPQVDAMQIPLMPKNAKDYADHLQKAQAEIGSLEFNGWESQLGTEDASRHPDACCTADLEPRMGVQCYERSVEILEGHSLVRDDSQRRWILGHLCGVRC